MVFFGSAVFHIWKVVVCSDWSHNRFGGISEGLPHAVRHIVFSGVINQSLGIPSAQVQTLTIDPPMYWVYSQSMFTLLKTESLNFSQ